MYINMNVRAQNNWKGTHSICGHTVVSQGWVLGFLSKFSSWVILFISVALHVFMLKTPKFLSLLEGVPILAQAKPVMVLHSVATEIGLGKSIRLS